MIARVFPRKTRVTPTDELAFFSYPNLLVEEENISEVHISCTFTWDIPKAEKLAKYWNRIAPVKIDGPAFNKQGGGICSRNVC
jgi:hypothetical protein